jgi:predicted glycoside hydrolase/deacetylase ChbG (UPF0249 family)
VPSQLDVREVEHEIRAQIERAIALGVQPTHVDSHQGARYSTRAVFGAMARVAGELGVPVMVSRTKRTWRRVARSGLASECSGRESNLHQA